MDLSDALFSPSKARQQQAQAKDWIFVDSWLSKKYHPKPVPNFERNEDTLQALMTLVAFNERADEEQLLLERVENEALRELQEKKLDPLDQTIYKTLTATLGPSGQKALTSQAEASLILNTSSPHPTTLAHHTTTLTTQHFDLEQQLARVTSLSATLSREHKRLSTLLQTLHSPTFQPPQDLAPQTTTWTRDVKMLQRKLDEYNERLAQYRDVRPPRPGVADIAERQAELGRVKGRLRDVNARIEWFQGLPPDVSEARRVLEGLKDEFRGLVDVRNERFEGLVEGGGEGSQVPVR